MKKYLVLLLVSLTFIACGSDDTLGPAISEVDLDAINIRAINQDGDTQVEIGLNIFGESEDELDGATFGLAVNDITLSDSYLPLDYYVDSVQVVAFYIHELVDGDVITFTINLIDGGSVIYAGTVSVDSDQQAAIIVDSAETDDTQDTDDNLLEEDDTNSVTITPII